MSSPKTKIWLAAGCALMACAIVGVGGLLLVFGFIPAPQPTPPPLIFPTRSEKTSTPLPPPETPTPTPTSSSGPGGKIVYVCQIYKSQASDQICIINADGSGQRRLTTRDDARHFYPSLAPDGQSALFSSNMDSRFELYELDFNGNLTRLGQTGIAPEVSPDNRFIAFTQNTGSVNDSIWLMDRNGDNPRQVIENGWDPTWSPDGKRLLFASALKDGTVQLMTSNLDGSDRQQITDLPLLRGRSSWSADGKFIVTYSGQPWQRALYLFGADGSNPRPITDPTGNGQGPSFSPDGQWVAFTAYFDHPKNIHGCEIYIIRIDGTHLTRLTDNTFCDWQPRWGP